MHPRFLSNHLCLPVPCTVSLSAVSSFALPDLNPLHSAGRRVQLSAFFLSSCLLGGLLWSSASLADTGDGAAPDPNAITLALGAGIERLPSFPGAKSHRNEPIPYVDFEWPDHVSLSTLDGLQVDVIGGNVLHGGFFGDYQWGRDTEDLSPRLREKLNPLSPRLTTGGYLEWQLTKQFDVGTNLSHDINGAGAYLNVYAEWDLPKVWLIEHSLQVRWQAMNGPAMSRFFGVTPIQASELDVPSWRPGSGSQLADLEYDVFVPTGQHTGVALALTYGRLLGNAADSPLATRFGSATQISEALAFVYHW